MASGASHLVEQISAMRRSSRIEAPSRDYRRGQCGLEYRRRGDVADEEFVGHAVLIGIAGAETLDRLHTVMLIHRGDGEFAQRSKYTLARKRLDNQIGIDAGNGAGIHAAVGMCGQRAKRNAFGEQVHGDIRAG